MNKFYINLDSNPERAEYFDKTYQRWRAVTRDEVDARTKNKMISYWNTKPENHLGKCACFLSHYKLLKYIVNHKLNNVLVVEDDARAVTEIPENMDKFTYLAGFFINKKVTEGPLKTIPKQELGLNSLEDKDYYICTTVAYYLPKWDDALDILLYLDRQKRWRAIDIMLMKSPIKKDYQYPAPYEEAPMGSNIRKGKIKYCNMWYEYK